MPDETLFNRMRSEYLEMPGLRLTRPQAQRLYGLDEATCQRLLDTLVNTRFLCVRPDGTYARLFDGTDIPRPKPAKVDLRLTTGAVKMPA